MRTKPNFSGTAYLITFTLTEAIKISKPGKHLISFYSYFDCKKPECSSVGDAFSVYVKDSYSYEEVFRTGTEFGRYEDLTWKKDEIEILVRETQIFVSYKPVFSLYKIISFLIINKVKI